MRNECLVPDYRHLRREDDRYTSLKGSSTGKSMYGRRSRIELPNWSIPVSYAVIAVLTGFILPRIESHWLPEIESGLSAVAAVVIYSSVASGMMALTAVVFSLVFVMVQFSAIAYSPRLVPWIVRDRVLWHSLGVFTATFLYSLAAIAWLDRNRSGRVPFFSGWLVIVLLLASVAMLVALVERISSFQIRRMLTLTGDHGRLVIEKMYPSLETAMATAEFDKLRQLPLTHTVLHTGRPSAVQAIDARALLTLSSAAGGIMEVVSSPGDLVVEGTPLVRVYGAAQYLDQQAVRKTFEMGEERTFEQDPKYAIRLLVDIAIKALSPAINDPTTAVQALDQIEDLLRRLGSRRLEIGAIHDSRGTLRLMIPHPAWEDFLILAFEEIRFYGATSVQVMRRMNALISDLISALPQERHKPLQQYQLRLNATIAKSFENTEDRQEASVEDRQGLGSPRRDP
jgi:uncharacterized membrane protein